MQTNSEDSYYTIENPVLELLLKEKNSKFISYAFPVFSDEEIKNHLATIKKKHPNANHACYAYQIGYKTVKYRASDDGEPNNSAGKPIYGQIQSFHFTNILVVVVRYFGGVKLGVGGLVTAYKMAAKMALEAAQKVECIEMTTVNLKYEYEDHPKIMNLLKESKASIKEQKMELNCEWTITIPEKEYNQFREKCESFKTCKITKIDL
ncbi:IMPACT family protein [Flavobacterium sp. UBA6135]|uniref:IMPACT family protein n=1 Tax=Flavobacterium sp. UBA6135 TaxID=1946553 RepID=UPI0025BFCF50|nr:YigZ family protein [Flavobacterium sp. UBA6135]